MSKATFYKSSRLSVFCIATLLFVLSTSMTSYGQEPCGNYEISVNVAANRINITSLDGTAHAVVVHTNQHYSIVNRSLTQVFVNDGENGDCPIASFGQREDDNGHLDIYFLLDSLKACAGALVKNYEFNILRIEGVETGEDDPPTFCGESYMHIVGKQGHDK